MSQLQQQVRDLFLALDEGDWNRFGGALTEDCHFQAPGGSGQGRDAVIGWVRPFVDAIPDIRHEILTYAAEGPFVAVEVRVTGTHTAPLATPAGEVPPTGRPIDLVGSDMWRIDAGRISAYHVYFDQMSLLGQLGLVPEPAAA